MNTERLQGTTTDADPALVDRVVRWVKTKEGDALNPAEWKLMVRKRSKDRCVATVWDNNFGTATWHTWDRHGVGGENDVEKAETPAKAVRKAMIEASASAIFQGFI